MMIGGLKNKGIIKKSEAGRPLVTIITPVLNGNTYLEYTIQSVLNQIYDNIEYIIIDGGSTDGTLDIIRKYEEKIDYWLSAADSKMYDAINKGIKIASGVILAYLNSDDLYYADTVQRAVAYFQDHQNTELIYGNCDFIGPKEEFIYTYHYPKFRWKSFVLRNISSIPQSTTFWRKAIHEKVGLFDATLTMCGDFDFYAKVGKCCCIEHIGMNLAKHRVHRHSLTFTQGYRNKEEIEIIHKRYLGPNKRYWTFLRYLIELQNKILNLSVMFKKLYLCFRKGDLKSFGGS